MHFRPLPGITIAVTIMLGILLGLGFWQLQRLQWKLGLIEQVHRAMAAAPLSFDDARRLGAAAEYRRVRLVGRYGNAKEAYVYDIGVEGVPVFHVIVPFTLDDGRIVLVDRGIVPRDMRNPALRPAGIDNREATFTGIWRTPPAPGLFTGRADPAQRIWFSRDIAAIAHADNVTLAAPVLIEADATPNPGGWPRGGQTRVEFRNEHLQYAITWFLMAAALLGVYLAYHVSTGRLALKRPD